LAINVLFALHKHVNYSANRYLCAYLLLTQDAEAEREAQGCDGGGQTVLFNAVRCRQRSQRRLMKLLFEQLFSAHLYTNRQQIGRGRFASVYSASYAGASASSSSSSSRVALKQVEQPTSIHDQMCLVDLFTEISILDTLACDARARAGSGTCGAAAALPAIEVLDFGVGDGAYWIVLPLAQGSLRAFKLAQAEEPENDKEARMRDAQNHALIGSLLEECFDYATFAAVRPHLATLGSTSRRLLSSLALFAQVLQSLSSLQRRDIVHFDLKAENFLLLVDNKSKEGENAVGGGGSSAQQQLPPPPVPKVVLADFGEALFVPSSTCLHGSSSSLFSNPNHKLSRGTENIQAPEMLTLIRALDRSDQRFDRRRAQFADKGSDIWATGCLFYEIVMHQYGDKAIVEAANDRDAAGAGAGAGRGMSGSGMLFEEAGGLPIFLQVTSSALPLLSDEKRAALSRPDLLGPSLLGPCVSLLEFILRRERLQRPSLTQVQAKFRDTVREVLRLALHAVKAPEIALQFRPARGRKTTMLSSSAGGEPAFSSSVSAPVPHGEDSSCSSSDACWCSPLPSRWRGQVPPVRCARCTLSKTGASAPTSDSLRALCARRTDSAAPALSAAATLVGMHWCAEDAVARVLVAEDAEAVLLRAPSLSSHGAAASLAPPLLLVWDDALLASLDVSVLRERRVCFLQIRLGATGDVPADYESALPLPPGGSDLAAFVPTADLETARTFVHGTSQLHLLCHSQAAAALVAVLEALLVPVANDSSSACMSIALGAALRSAAHAAAVSS
jgi:serine/threonine protein kinase